MACEEFVCNHVYVMTQLRGSGVVPLITKHSIDDLSVEYEFVPGEHIEDVPHAARADCFAAAGRALALFHLHGMAGYGPVHGERETQEDWWSIQDRRVAAHIEYCHDHKVLDESLIAALSDAYGVRRRKVPVERASCLAHRDFRCDNLLFAQDSGQWRCTVIDFDHVMACPDHCDFGRIELDVFRQWPDFRGAFLEGYGSARQLPDLDSALPVYGIIWPLGNIVWGSRHRAEGLVRQAMGQLAQQVER
jgi:Ser/Thr protein kinase RdoA (MazF antagonist)